MIVATVVLAGQFVLAISTERGDYYVPAQGKRLTVDPKKCETFLASIEEKLRVRVPRYQYYRVADERALAEEKGMSASGVAFLETNEIWSTKPCHQHEMIHLASFQAGRPGSFWEEGLAVGLGNDYDWRSRTHRRFLRDVGEDLPELMADFAGLTDVANDVNRWSYYAAVGAFMRHLIHTQGMPKVAQYFCASWEQPDRDGEIFKSIFGQHPVDMINAWSGYKPRQQ